MTTKKPANLGVYGSRVTVIPDPRAPKPVKALRAVDNHRDAELAVADEMFGTDLIAGNSEHHRQVTAALIKARVNR